jgi:hypothetical protein
MEITYTSYTGLAHALYQYKTQAWDSVGIVGTRCCFISVWISEAHPPTLAPLCGLMLVPALGPPFPTCRGLKDNLRGIRDLGGRWQVVGWSAVGVGLVVVVAGALLVGRVGLGGIQGGPVDDGLPAH